MVLNSDPDSHYCPGCDEQTQNWFWNLLKIKSPQQANTGKVLRNSVVHLQWTHPRNDHPPPTPTIPSPPQTESTSWLRNSQGLPSRTSSTGSIKETSKYIIQTAPTCSISTADRYRQRNTLLEISASPSIYSAGLLIQGEGYASWSQLQWKWQRVWNWSGSIRCHNPENKHIKPPQAHGVWQAARGIN